MAWDEAKRQAARERMAKARAAKKINRSMPVDVYNEPLDPPLAAQDDPGRVKYDGQPDLVLMVRRLRVGSFTGLWELSKMRSDGSIEVITDANTKQLMINLARNEILKCGQ
jgi:hypothetical protein